MTPSLRGDHLLVAQMVERGFEGGSTSVRRGRSPAIAGDRGIDGRGIRAFARGRHRCFAKYLAWLHGYATPTDQLPDDASIM